MNDEIIKICPNCGNKTSHELLSKITTDELIEGWDNDYNIETFPMETYYFVIKCKSCTQVSIYTSSDADELPDKLEMAIQIYPVPKDLELVVPDIIQKSYIEAKKVKQISPLAFVIMIRRALEILCENNNAKGNNLKQKIDDLGQRNIIPERLAEMANTLREVGNIGTHSKEYQFDKFDADFLDDFFTAMVEYIYVAPNTINRLKEKLKKKKTAGNNA